MQKLNLKIVKCHKDAKIPEYGTPDAACFDICTTHDVKWDTKINNIIVVPGLPCPQFIRVATIKTGLKVEVPSGYALKLYPRSGAGFKKLIQLGNGTGIIDADYRGEIFVKLVCLDPSQTDEDLKIVAGDSICQGSIEKIERVNFEVVQEEDLSITERGSGGLGHTGGNTLS